MIHFLDSDSFPLWLIIKYGFLSYTARIFSGSSFHLFQTYTVFPFLRALCVLALICEISCKNSLPVCHFPFDFVDSVSSCLFLGSKIY